MIPLLMGLSVAMIQELALALWGEPLQAIQTLSILMSGALTVSDGRKEALFNERLGHLG